MMEAGAARTRTPAAGLDLQVSPGWNGTESYWPELENSVLGSQGLRVLPVRGSAQTVLLYLGMDT